MVKLTPGNLYDYFAVATEQDSAIVAGLKLFDFVDRQSDTLIVTIGDSWTWGTDLTNCDLGCAHFMRLPDDDYRIKHVYGNVVAEAIGADFLNLGESGSGNWYIVRKMQELQNLHTFLNYKKILIFAVWTELGRDFDSHHDVDVDYRSWLLDNIKTYHDYYRFMKVINNHIAQKISKIISGFGPQTEFWFSTTFVDTIGVELLSNYWMDQTWLQVMCGKNQKTYEPAQCYTVFPWCIEKFDMVFNVAPELDRLDWLQWINEITDAANTRLICIRDNNLNLTHPSAVNHQCWADFILDNLHATA